MEGWDTLIPWITEQTGEELGAEFLSELGTGELLCKLMNSLNGGKIQIKANASTDSNAALTNLENFLQSCKDLGVDDQHLFDLKGVHNNPDPDAEVLDEVRITLASLKTLIEQRGTLEKQNIWRRDAAETRAVQNHVKHSFAKKEDKTLTDVTTAVRAFKEGSNQDADLRYQKQGQQKWGLFETNYQRNKGISLEQSLAEIEEFERTGKMPESMKKPNVNQRQMIGTSNGFNKMLEETLNKDDNNSSTNKTGGGRFGKAGGATSSSAPGQKFGGGKGELTVKPKAGGAGGAAFFQQFAEQEQRKFRPGNSNADKKLW